MSAPADEGRLGAGHLLLELLWVAVVVLAPALGAWTASSLAAYLNGPVWLAAAAGLLLFPVLPLAWEAWAASRRRKNKVETTRERMRVQTARYRGQDNQGRPFTLDAASAVQVSSSDPVVAVTGMEARMALESGPALIEAERGRYDMEAETVDVIGPILFSAADGYRLETRDVTVPFEFIDLPMPVR